MTPSGIEQATFRFVAQQTSRLPSHNSDAGGSEFGYRPRVELYRDGHWFFPLVAKEILKLGPQRLPPDPVEVIIHGRSNIRHSMANALRKFCLKKHISVSLTSFDVPSSTMSRDEITASSRRSLSSLERKTGYTFIVPDILSRYTLKQS
jgi:hypothetical protein